MTSSLGSVTMTTMSTIRQNPVAVLTTVYVILAAVTGVVVEFHALPDRITGYLVLIVAILSAVLGAITHQKVTPLVNPRNNDGMPLVPLRPGGPVK